MKKLIFYFVVFFSFLTNTQAQQMTQFSQYILNMSVINPAAVGSNDLINVYGNYRNQYSNFDGSPQTFVVSADIGFNIGKTKHGAGISFYDDEIGAYKNQDINIQYAYRFPINEGFLSGGLNIGFTSFEFSSDDITEVESDYHDPSDPVIPTASGNDFKMDLGVGFLFRNKNWFAGASLLNIFSPEYDINETGTIQMKRPMNLNITGGYNISFNNPLYKLKTYSWVRTDFVTFTAEIDADLQFKEVFWGGLGYRYNDAVIFRFGIKVLDGLVIGYSYDLPTSKLIYSGGVHEIVIAYSFSLDFSKKNKYKSVRFL